MSRLSSFMKESKTRSSQEVRKKSICVQGIGCRFPGNSDTPEAYWNMMINKTNTSSIVNELKDVDSINAPFISPLNDPYLFDHAYFNISKSEAMSMDPQSMQSLEVATLALLDAGYTKEQVFESNGAVYIGAHVQNTLQDMSSVYSVTASALSCISGRISFVLGMKGASVTIDAACAASLVCIDFATKSVKHDEHEFALAEGRK